MVRKVAQPELHTAIVLLSAFFYVNPTCLLLSALLQMHHKLEPLLESGPALPHALPPLSELLIVRSLQGMLPGLVCASMVSTIATALDAHVRQACERGWTHPQQLPRVLRDDAPRPAMQVTCFSPFVTSSPELASYEGLESTISQMRNCSCKSASSATQRAEKGV